MRLSHPFSTVKTVRGKYKSKISPGMLKSENASSMPIFSPYDLRAFSSQRSVHPILAGKIDWAGSRPTPSVLYGLDHKEEGPIQAKSLVSWVKFEVHIDSSLSKELSFFYGPCDGPY